MTYLMMGKIDRAQDFIRLDAGSEWAAYENTVAAMRTGRLEDARESSRAIATNLGLNGNLLQACVSSAASSEMERIGREAERMAQSQADPERRFSFGEVLFFCNQTDAGLRTMQGAIEGNYCAHEALQHDPMLARLRSMHEYGPLLNQAKACEDSFLAARDRDRP